MKISGIVVEYNPLHNGHLYHINKTKECTNSDLIIAVMSGNFNQRGIPSIIDKWTKTKTALDNGVDIVFELPTVYSLSSAEFFSFGAISLLNSLDVVDSICFGSESGNIDFLDETAQLLVSEPPYFKKLLKEQLNKGLAFPKARAKALNHYLEKNSDYPLEELNNQLNSSNNILGVEYIKSLKKLNSSIEPYTIQRQGGSYNSTTLDSNFSSATSIRNALKTSTSLSDLKTHMPLNVVEQFIRLKNMGYTFPFDYMMYDHIRYKAMMDYKNMFELLPDVSEGLHNKMLSTIKECTTYDECITKVKSKRYAYTRLSRILCQYFLNFYDYDIATLRKMPCPYARLLGFNENGKSILKSIKNNSNIPIYSKIPKEINETLAIDLKATEGYSILNPSIRYNEDLLTSPIMLCK